jgi:hypothetical protein
LSRDKEMNKVLATARLFAGLLGEALEYEREAWEADEDVEGADLVEWFGGWRERVQALLLAELIHGPVIPRIVIGLEGGIVQGASTNVPVEIMVRDYDTDCGDLSELIEDPEHGDCFAYEINSSVDPKLIKVTERQMDEVRQRREKEEAERKGAN